MRTVSQSLLAHQVRRYIEANRLSQLEFFSSGSGIEAENNG
jgi:hypothetical protein